MFLIFLEVQAVSPKVDKYSAYRLYNLDRLERKITGKSDNILTQATAKLNAYNQGMA